MTRRDIVEGESFGAPDRRRWPGYERPGLWARLTPWFRRRPER